MKKRNMRKKKEQIIRYESDGISESRMIEIQAEAYYRAMKKIEQDKENLREQLSEKKKDKWWVNILLFLNMTFFPWKINKKLNANNQNYDVILVVFVSEALIIVGTLMWLFGIIDVIIGIYKFLKLGINGTLILGCIFDLSLVFLGSLFIPAGIGFSKELDSNKIYAYSASIIALVSCVVSIIAVIKTIT